MSKSKLTPAEQRLKKHEENRRYPRIVVECPITLLLADAIMLKAQAYDISPGGLQIRCDKKTAQQLLAKTKKPEEKTSKEFGVSLLLPLDDKEAKVIVQCIHVHMVGLEENVFAIGLSFTSVKGESKAVLKRFIEASMEPE